MPNVSIARPVAMTVEYDDLSANGLLCRPGDVAAAPDLFAKDVVAYLDSDRDVPEPVGDVPNLREFATGIDHNVGAFEIKAKDSHAPARNVDRPVLPVRRSR
jgi:hypothetical protein